MAPCIFVLIFQQTSMPIIDVPDYYRLAAENYDNAERMCRQAVELLSDEGNLYPNLSDDKDVPGIQRLVQQKLEEPVSQDVIALIGFVSVLDDDDILSPAVVVLCRRHDVRNQMLGLVSPLYLCHDEIPLKKMMNNLIEKYHSIVKRSTGRD